MFNPLAISKAALYVYGIYIVLVVNSVYVLKQHQAVDP
jgi:hypothetical protein